MKFARIIIVLSLLVIMGVSAVAVVVVTMSNSLPPMIKLEDYKPLLVTEVYARGGEKIAEFSRENRRLQPIDKIPKKLIGAFVAAEDDTFFEHKGVNYLAILRAFLVNLTSGEKRQGASTITQQVARSLLLSSEKTYTRKIKEIMLAQKMEDHLSKQDILYLYLNQIYFGEGAYGIATAAQTYFHKDVENLNLGEMAILAGLPQAPSSYSPTEHPQKAKARQRYVLSRMRAIGQITDAEMKQALNEPIKVYVGKEFKPVAPYFVETVRQLLVQDIGEAALLDQGLKVYTSVDFKAQQAANEQVQAGLRQVDKREGYRGPEKNLATPEEQKQFLLAERKALKYESTQERVIQIDGNFAPDSEFAIYHNKDSTGKIVGNIPDYITKGQIVDGIVEKIDDQAGLTEVRFAEGQGLIDISDMAWARKPDTSIFADLAPKIKRPSEVVKVGDVISVKVVGPQFQPNPARLKEMLQKKKSIRDLPAFNEYAQLSLEQKPLVEGALLSFDEKSGEVIAMVGGFEFLRNKNEFNRTLQAKRQTGSAFKTIVYAAALDKGYTPATPIQDAPVVFTEEEGEGQDEKTWKPHNNEQKFEGDILFRSALIRSLNVPTVKILEKIGVGYTVDYARRLGVFSPLNQDLSMGLGSSSLTLYEMTKVLANLGRLGKKLSPIIVHKVVDQTGKVLVTDLSLDQRFATEIAAADNEFAQHHPSPTPGVAQTPAADVTAGATPAPEIFPADPNQLIKPQTAYLTTSLLSGVIYEQGGTGIRASAFGRPAAGKTGSSSGYFDGWFIGYSPQIATGVWVGYDNEQSLGLGEVGGHTALPIWLEYMKTVHTDLPEEDFTVPPGITFANIDSKTGLLASASSKTVVKQAFLEGTEPKTLSDSGSSEDENEFLKKDFTE